MKRLFEDIVAIPSVSGNEQDLQKRIDKELRQYVDKITTDALGNNIKVTGQGKTKIMLTAHCDEVGFIVTYIDEKGFAYFKPVGGIKKDIAVGQKVKIITDNGMIPGVIGRDATNPITDKSQTKELWIDIGITEKTDTIAVGARVFFDTTYELLQANCAIARGGDNAVGVYATTEITKAFSKNSNRELQLITVLSTQEEVGLRGAHVVVKEVNPNYSFIIDTIDTTDTPNAAIEDEGKIILGKGPVITFGAGTDDNLFGQFKKIATKEKIPLQIIAQASDTSTDTDEIQVGNMGVVSMIVSIPVRYMHTPNVLFCWDDVENTIKLITSMLAHLDV
jgi:putative aminopeptidase FrvX